MDELYDYDSPVSGIEKFIMGIYTLYALSISYMAYAEKWAGWGTGLVLITYFLVLIAMLTGYKNRYIRSMILTVGMGVCLFFRGYNASDITQALPTVFLFTAMIGMLGVTEEVVVLGVVNISLCARQFILMLESGNAQASGVVYQMLGSVFFVLVIFIWVRHRNENLEKYSRSNEIRLETEQARDEFLSNVSHELRTPLNVVNTIVETLDDENDIEIIKNEVRNLRSASRRMSFMTSDIMDFTELYKGEVKLENQNYNIADSIRYIIDMAQAAIDDKKLEFIVDLDTSMPEMFFGDEKKVRRIIMNFVDNAVKFTDSGYVALKVGGRKESYGFNLSISVTDSGIGMDEAMVEKLLEGYDRFSTNRYRQGEGIGLGMAISKLLANALGGIITIKSSPHEGSTFTLVVPQSVISPRPLALPDNAQDVRVCVFYDIEKNDMEASRDVYSALIRHMADNFRVDMTVCNTFEDMKKCLEGGKVTHLFVKEYEYEAYRDYLEAVNENIALVVGVEKEDDLKDAGKRVIRLSKPYYSLKVARILSNEVLPSQKSVSDSEELKTKGVRALVVDDNRMNIHVVSNLLKKYGIETVGAASGAEALEKVTDMDYDIIFMDHMMPEMDGVETTERIRGKFGEYYQRVPIVALTANAIAGSREKYLASGFDEFMEKPVEPPVMERILEKILPKDKLVKEKAHVEVKKIMNENNEIMDKLDKETGLMYCGGEENYGIILAECVLSYNDTSKDLEEAYEKEDYSYYVIKVHGLKSTMKSIGAMELSEKARLLEMAGKSGDYQTIKKGHREVMQDYYDMMKAVSTYGPTRENLDPGFDFESFAVKSSGKSEEDKEIMADMTGLEEISADKLDDLKHGFEGAMYSLDDEAMKKYVAELKNCRYGDVNLADIAAKMEHKIEMGDYFSAGDLLLNL